MNLRCLQTTLFVTLLLASLLPTLAGCQQIPPEYKEFFDLPVEQQRERLKSFTIDKQIEYHLAGHQYFHPPIEFTEIIASQGKDAIPHLEKKLREEKIEYRQVVLMYLFKHIHFFYYDLSGEKEALELLKEVTAKMGPSYHKENAEKILKDILENRAPDLKRFKEERPKAFTKDSSNFTPVEFGASKGR